MGHAVKHRTLGSEHLGAVPMTRETAIAACLVPIATCGFAWLASRSQRNVEAWVSAAIVGITAVLSGAVVGTTSVICDTVRAIQASESHD